MEHRRGPLQQSYERILEKSVKWITAMNKFTEKDDCFEYLDYKDVESGDEVLDSKDEDDENDENNERALVESEDFEGSSSPDENEDVDELVNETLNDMQYRVRAMEENGIIDALNSFDYDKIKTICVPWMEKNKLDQSNTSLHEHVVHIEEHRHHQHNIDSEDSLQSVDTANYIKQNRHKRLPSCTTTTIKKISYVKGLQKSKVAKKCNCDCENNRDLISVFQRNYPKNINLMQDFQNFGVKIMQMESIEKKTSYTPPATARRTEASKSAMNSEPLDTPLTRSRPLPKRVKSLKLKRRSDPPTTSKRPISSSSSEYPGSPIHRRRRRISRQKGNYSTKPLPSSSSDTSEDLPSRCKTKNSKSPKKLTGVAMRESNETGFLANSIINSTSVPTRQCSPKHVKNCQISPIANRTDQTANNNTIAENHPENPNEILLYRPNKKSLHKSSIYITLEDFQNNVGKEYSSRFVKVHFDKFPLKFDANSTVFFQLPPDSKDECLSDDDFLAFVDREGEIVEKKEYIVTS